MSKKNRKSLFTWCIRTLAVSLVPTLLLVSCASDSDDDKAAADTTVPTFSTTGHSAALIPVLAFGPQSSQFSGFYQNTDIYHKIREALAL